MAIGPIGRVPEPVPPAVNGSGGQAPRQQQQAAAQTPSPAANTGPPVPSTIPNTYSIIRITNDKVYVRVVDQDNGETLLEFPPGDLANYVQQQQLTRMPQVVGEA